MADAPQYLLQEALDAALAYINHVAANKTERGESHPQALLVAKLEAARAALSAPLSQPVAWVLRTEHGEAWHSNQKPPYPEAAENGWLPLYADPISPDGFKLQSDPTDRVGEVPAKDDE